MDVSNIDQEVEALFQKQWNLIESQANSKSEGPGKSWGFAITPPFPKHWPANDEGYAYYAYLSRPGFPTGIADGQLIGMIWGSVSVTSKNGTPELVFAPFKFDAAQYKIQGARPLQSEELESLKIAPWTALLTADQKLLKRYYCTWKSMNGVILEAVSPQHTDFFKYLGCLEKKDHAK